MSLLKTFSLSLIFLTLDLFSQGPAINQQKYWHYRERLTSQFLVVGPNQGESIPAGIRNIYNTGGLHFGDGLVYLGHYIGVLATEYRMLKDNNQPLDRTLTELYYALKAVERLDAGSEVPYGHSPNLNGCMMLDDVPASFINDHPQLNDNINSSFIQSGSGICGPVDAIYSTYAGDDQSDAEPEDKKSLASQDNYYNLLMGLALVKKFVDPGVIPFNDNISTVAPQQITFDFRGNAIGYAVRIFNYFSNSGWVLNTPDGSNISNGDGGDARGFSYGVAEAAQFFTAQDFNGGWTSADYILWQSYGDNHLWRANSTNITLPLILASIGDSWYDGINHRNSTREDIAWQGDYDASSTGSYSENHYGWDLYYGLIHRYLNNNSIFDIPGIDVCRTESILNTAPWDGPFFHSSADKALNGWACSFRFYGEPPDQDNGKADFKGNYNGLDYMLFHNLYFLVNRKKTYISGYYPERHSEYNWLGFFTGYSYDGWTDDPLFVYAPFGEVIPQNLFIGHYFERDGDVRILGGSAGVTLYQSVDVQEGSFLDVQAIDHYACSNDIVDFVIPANFMRTTISSSKKKETDSVKSIFYYDLLIVYPNPSAAGIEVRLPDFSESTINLEIFNSLGNTVLKKQIAEQNNLINVPEFSDFENGYYILKMTLTGSNKVIYSKVIKI